MKTDNGINRITVEDMAPHVHDFKPGENKVDKITLWLTNWIINSLECRKIQPGDFLPPKSDLAYHMCVSLGTMQSVYRNMEDRGFVKSKQRIGTYIAKPGLSNSSEKLTSKSSCIVDMIKKFILEEGYITEDVLPSTREFAELFNISASTVRTAITKLMYDGIISKKGQRYILVNPEINIEETKHETLVEKTAAQIQDYIKRELSSGDKIPSNTELSKMFKVSVKTINDAVKILVKNGIVYSKRGKYGTIVADSENISGKDREYCYEIVYKKIKKHIVDNCKIGDKLSPIKDMAIQYETSEKTIKTALDMLMADGIVAFMRGRYGGTFITDVPDADNESYKWLAINSDYVNKN